MFTSFEFRPSRTRGVFVLALVSAFLAIPALAYAGRGTTTRVELAGPAGYCQFYNAAAGPSVGKVQITTTPASVPGFHPVRVNVKLSAGEVPAGTYQVWLVNVYRDETGQVVGCAASPLENQLTVKNNHPAGFQGFADRYTGEHELQVYVGPIWGPGYGTAPALVDVP